MSSKNSSVNIDNSEISWDDATWILTSSFIIFTMQTGFSLLESGSVRTKNQTSIMLKSCCDPLFSGLAFWTIGYGISLTSDLNYTNPFFGLGQFLVDSTAPDMGQLFSSYVHRLSMASTASTVVLGAMAERITFIAYCIFCFFITIMFAVPNYWIWSPNGFLRKLKAVDIAGCSTIHLVGGMSGLVATIILKPRLGRFSKNSGKFSMSSPTNALLGTYMLWWGWVGLHTSSTFGISDDKWKYAARSTVSTIIASSSGGANGLLLSFLFMKRKFDIKVFICGLLSGLVSISSGCTLYQPLESFIIGWIGSSISILSIPLLRVLKIDDPVDTIAIHLSASIWGMIALALIVRKDTLMQMTYGQNGIINGGSFRFLGVQILSIAVISIWSAFSTILVLFSIRLVINIRLSLNDELRGADYVEHNSSWDTHDDSLLPKINRFNKSTARSFARRRFKKVINALRATQRFSSYHKRDFLKRQIKENQAKTLAQSWPKGT